MTVYYRFTNKETPMSDWGHAMFAEDRDSVDFYGNNEYHLPVSSTVDINELEDAIKSAWNASIADEDFGDIAYSDWANIIENISADEAFEQFNPDDIVNSAAAYDSDWVCWLWERVLAPRGIMAVRTTDGAICFDESLIVAV